MSLAVRVFLVLVAAAAPLCDAGERGMGDPRNAADDIADNQDGVAKVGNLNESSTFMYPLLSAMKNYKHTG